MWDWSHYQLKINIKVRSVKVFGKKETILVTLDTLHDKAKIFGRDNLLKGPSIGSSDYLPTWFRPHCNSTTRITNPTKVTNFTALTSDCRKSDNRIPYEATIDPIILSSPDPPTPPHPIVPECQALLHSIPVEPCPSDSSTTRSRRKKKPTPCSLQSANRRVSFCFYDSQHHTTPNRMQRGHETLFINCRGSSEQIGIQRSNYTSLWRVYRGDAKHCREIPLESQDERSEISSTGTKTETMILPFTHPLGQLSNFPSLTLLLLAHFPLQFAYFVMNHLLIFTHNLP